MNFTEHLINYIRSGQLTLGVHDTGHWLKLLTRDELDQLSRIVERTFLTPPDIHPDLPELVLLLVQLETRQTAVALDDLVDLLQFLLMMCQLETYVRQQYIKIYGWWRITDPNDENHYASLTVHGYRAADAPDAPPFLRYLKQKTGSTEWN